MTEFVLALLVAVRVFFRTRRDTALEILALRHQVAVLKRKRPRPPLNSVDRLFWATLASSIQRSPHPDSPSAFSISTVLSSAMNRGCRNHPSGPTGRASPERSTHVGWKRSLP